MGLVEKWREISDFPGYEVSNPGHVRSVDRVIVFPDGRTRFAAGQQLKPAKKATGHLYVNLGRSNPQLIHRLVLTTFVGRCPPGKECLHRDGQPDNNRVTNLRWGTRSENQLDAVPHGTYRGSAKLNTDQVIQIRNMLDVGCPHSAIAIAFNVSRPTISLIKSGKIWKRALT